MATLIQHYTVPIQIAHSSTDSADTSPFVMHATGGAGNRYIRLASYDLTITWNGLAATPSAKAGYWLNRFTILLPRTLPSGGTAVVPVPDDPNALATCVERCLIKQDGALTTTNMTNYPIALFASGNGVTGQTQRFSGDFGAYGPIAYVNQGFNLSMLAAAVAGQTLTGYLRYAEYQT